MKLRNRLLALACLLVFAVFGWLYVRTWVVQKPFGIILFVSDSMVARHLAAARLYEGGADHRLGLESLPHWALVRNDAADFAVPDAAAAATALATGHKTNHRAVGLDPQGRKLPTILELARAAGRATGLVTNGPLAGPSAAAFYAHHPDAREAAQLAKALTGLAELDVALGGGGADFLPPAGDGARPDGRNLMAELRRTGRQVVGTRAELEDAGPDSQRPLLGVFSPGPLAFSHEVASGGTQPTLPDMVRRAIQFLQTNSAGYVLVVDATLATTAAERNLGEALLAETIALDHAIATAQKYAGEGSLIIAVGKHATGGLALNGYPLRQDHGVALLGTNASGHPAVAWATGPNGPAPAADTAARSVAEPAAFRTPSGLNTAEDVLATGIGDGAEKLHGFLDNTAIFHVLRDAL
jgi:alkaline phosphatase